MNDMTPEERVVVGIVDADPLAHAAAVFDLIHAHEGAGTRGIDPVIAARHRDSVTAAILEHAEAILSADVDMPLPANIVGGRRIFARGRIQTAISQLLHHTSLAMIEAGLCTRRHMTPLASGRAMFAVEIAEHVLALARDRRPDLVEDLERRSIAA